MQTHRHNGGTRMARDAIGRILGARQAGACGAGRDARRISRVRVTRRTRMRGPR
jgi:hypothetical protein